MRRVSASIACIALASCAAVDIRYVPPPDAPPVLNAKVIDKARAAVWDSSVPVLGKQSLVINSLDRSSGVVSISYNGDLTRYIDCGRATSQFSFGAASRSDRFEYSKPQQLFYSKDAAGIIVFIDQKMSLEAHANLVFEERSPAQTRVSANALYTVRRQQVVQYWGGAVPASTNSDTISFNSGGGAAFPWSGDGLPSQCIATGALETELLSLIQ
jgi:hypothetical protein